MYYDFPLDQLKEYQPPRTEALDFDMFWEKTLLEVRKYPLNAEFDYFNSGLRIVDVFDVTYNGYNGQPVKGWLILPRDRPDKLPCIVEYIGYGGGRGHPIDWLIWSNVGYAHFVMDTRGQGSVWLPGNTPDKEPDGANPQHPGFMTRGIFDPKKYYYRRVISDGVRAVEAARNHEAIDPKRIAVTGISQGGGVSIAVSALDPNIEVVMPDVPFLCDFQRATEITDSNPYQEIVGFCKIHRDKVDQVFNTLSYFDGVNFASRSRSTALFSVALMDLICPPSTVFAAYNHFSGPKQIKIWPYNDHEGGETFQTIEKIKFLNSFWPQDN